MSFKNKTTQKLISAFMIVAFIAPVVLLYQPKKVNAQFAAACITPLGPCSSESTSWLHKLLLGVISGSGATTATQTTNTSAQVTIKNIRDLAEKILQAALRAIAAKALQQMTLSTINWINGGFHGAPLFLQNPESFFKTIAESEIKNLIQTVGYDKIGFPFGQNLALQTINEYKSTFATNAQYTLSNVINDPILAQEYRTNFKLGGWNAFVTNTQFPQNNYFGARQMYEDELGRKVADAFQSKAQSVKDVINQGQGFLSPQTCPGNPAYNNLHNEFQKPTYKDLPLGTVPKLQYDYDISSEKYGGGDYYSNEQPIPTVASQKAYDDYMDAYRAKNAAARAEWAKKNECKNADGTSGLVNTTPGSVIGNQIMTSLSSNYRQSELARALGNDLSAIFDALINKLMSTGLNALTKGVNSLTNGGSGGDNFSYQGQTLGSPGTTVNGNTSLGPDIVITLSDFKQKVQSDINDANLSLRLIDNTQTDNPGISQLLSQIWPKVRELDICVPGPDLGWQSRLDAEAQRNSQAIQTGAVADGTTGTDNSTQVTDATNELQKAVDFFKDWIKNKITTELPSGASYLGAINQIETLNQEGKDLEDMRTAKSNSLLKLQAIQIALSGLKTQPDPGSDDEQTLIDLKQQYDSISADASSAFTLTSSTDVQNELNTDKARLSSLNTLITKCTTERTAKGWAVPGGRTSILNGKSTDTEQAVFCSLPAVGGYTHKSFVNPVTPPAYPEIPMLNANNVLNANTSNSSTSGVGANAVINIRISCNAIFRGTALDYKKDLPGTTPTDTPENLVDDTK